MATKLLKGVDSDDDLLDDLEERVNQIKKLEMKQKSKSLVTHESVGGQGGQEALQAKQLLAMQLSSLKDL